jgi:hypothetical protein
MKPKLIVGVLAGVVLLLATASLFVWQAQRAHQARVDEEANAGRARLGYPPLPSRPSEWETYLMQSTVVLGVLGFSLSLVWVVMLVLARPKGRSSIDRPPVAGEIAEEHHPSDAADIEVICPNCNGPRRVPRTALDKTVKCYRCGVSIAVGPRTDAAEAVLRAEEATGRASAHGSRGLAGRGRRSVKRSEDRFEEELEEEAGRLRRQRLVCQLLSFVFGLPGLGLLVGAAWQPAPLRTWLQVVGNLLLWVGIAFGVAYKRYRWKDVLLGLVPIIGLLILVCLADQKGQRLARLRSILDRRSEQDEV